MSKLIRTAVIVCLFVSVVPMTFAKRGQKRKLNFKYRMPKIARGIDLSEIPAGAEYEEGEIMVFFAPGTNGKAPKKSIRHEIFQRGGNVVEKRHYKIVPGLSLVKLPPGLTVEQALKQFNNMAGVVYASPNYIVRIMSNFPNDPHINNDPNDPDNLLWGMHNIGQTGGTINADIDAPQAWDLHTDANDIIVAVIDSGIDYSHPDLAANMWTDPNGSGYYGYDFCIDDYTLRDACSPVTASDMANHDILITGWNYSDDSSGLDPDILYGGITGRVILTGHDSDVHTVEAERRKR